MLLKAAHRVNPRHFKHRLPQLRLSISSSSSSLSSSSCWISNTDTRLSRSYSSSSGDSLTSDPNQTDQVVIKRIPAHIDYRFIQENAGSIAENIKNRKTSGDPHLVASLYEESNKLGVERDQVLHQRNQINKSIKQKGISQEERQKLIEESKHLKQKAVDLVKAAKESKKLLEKSAFKIPNITHPNSPIGPEENAVERKDRCLTKVDDLAYVRLGFKPRDHIELGTSTELRGDRPLFDLQQAAQIAGNSFYYFLNEGALLELALINYSMQKLVAKGYTPTIVPDLIHSAVLKGCGFQPRDDHHSQIYNISNHDLCLSATAEIPLAGLHTESIIDQTLPIRYVGYGRSFRTEVGGLGASTKGLYRVHQFSKVEIFVYSTPEQSDLLFEEIVSVQEEILNDLGLHFRVLDMPTEELGASAYCKVDMEAYMPGRSDFGEVSSTSNCLDYQARRLNIRYKTGINSGSTSAGTNNIKGHNAFAHTLNGTACAIPRMVIAILEQNQQADGSILIPPPLQPFMMGINRI